MNFISENALDTPSVDLDNGKRALSSLRDAELHDTGGTVGHGVTNSSATQLGDSFAFCNYLPSNYSWGWVE